ncbi:MAG: hypothetical protein BWK73_45985 [Thiothrix lacustris]|uniref:Heat-shock protein n=1 Tax=Thiothrix lacustris TaxID=525917 RepID=A0A1Y1QAL6_9GAMM|nr:MAG: hypothetical protein BWK73_45985 [Thiothrix lacustris]
MKWNSFTYQGQTYDLSHVHPFDWEYTAPATDKRPERTYRMVVQFSMHTFTRGIASGETVDQALLYRDTREERAFDFLRYALSTQLAGIVRQLGERVCYHTHHGTFFTIEAVNPEGVAQEYEVYFKLSRSSRKGWLTLYVQSAYVRDVAHGTAQPKQRKIGFQVIAYNIAVGKIIKAGR